MHWEYSRNQRRHTCIGRLDVEYTIRDCAPMGSIHKREHGFDLLVDDIFRRHGTTVKELKDAARSLEHGH